MMVSFRGWTGSLDILHFLLGVFLVLPKEGVSLELQPLASELLLQSHSNFTVVCSAWSQVKWRLPVSTPVDRVSVDNRGSSSVLQLVNVTWRNSGRYTCEEASADQSRDIDIFIPGRGPDEWFVPIGSGMVIKETEEGTIPCVVSDPKLNVSLYERASRTQVPGMMYEPARGFTGRLNDTSYVCVASDRAEERESRVFYVFSVLVPEVMDMELSVSSPTLKQGEVLTVNCTVRDPGVVVFSWDFPRRQEIEPLTDILPNQIRSFINITKATLADSGLYVCKVLDTNQRRTVKKNITVTVLDRGYVYLWLSGETNLTSVLHHTVELSVEVDAHPAPTITWSRDNKKLAEETTSINTTHLTSSRYVSTLTLVQVQMHQTGSYTVTAANEDDFGELIFYLEVTAPPRIMSLSEVGSNTIQCVTEGAPPPFITWYTCPSSHRCNHLSGSWKNLSSASGAVALQENITKVTEGGLTQVHSVLTLEALSSVSAVRCEAMNSAGGRARDLQVLTQSLLSQVTVLVVVLVLVITAVIFFIILITLWRKKPRYEAHWKLIKSVSSDGKQITYMDTEDLPYSSAWEIPRDHIVLGQVLGSGPFGRVVEATVSGLSHSGSMVKAAVKMVKPRTESVQSLMAELKVLAHLGPHLNIVNLLGACTSGGPVYLITEFCCHGDLLSYLQRNRVTFLQVDTPTRSDSDGGYMHMNKVDRSQNVALKELRNADVDPETSPTDQASSLLPSDSSALTLSDLMSFSFQIAQAMDFLSSIQCVHGDLAARNILVSEGKLVKVCDFGLARDLLKDQNYIIKGNSFLPLKWMSPESIFQKIYSSESDVWSYGVLLWEVFSLGCNPYPDLLTTRQFLSELKKGHRMDQPEHAPPDMSDLMKRCWEEDPQSRPSFSSLVIAMDNMLSDDIKQSYRQLTQDFLKGKSPAVVRSRQSLSTRAEDQSHGHTTAQGSPASDVKVQLLEAGSVETSPSHHSNIIPISDVTKESSSSGAVRDAVSTIMPNPPAMLEPQEMTSSEPAQPSASSCCEEEEESCL
ncbi:platelet-derived growth factor receptor beta [Kryptolebias marmoratus]|uniref:platelet-derived growth factor receptor beta n=1 Tax=Kryptolebias marmoratus TaxID=37003 RepID=UPI000D530C4F|nr:platelet-derived growth factor receptor beta [Kryptolebias marmoratus]